MSIDTHGKIKGFVRHEDILNFIRQKWDKNVKDSIEKKLLVLYQNAIGNIKELVLNSWFYLL